MFRSIYQKRQDLLHLSLLLKSRVTYNLTAFFPLSNREVINSGHAVSVFVMRACMNVPGTCHSLLHFYFVWHCVRWFVPINTIQYNTKQILVKNASAAAVAKQPGMHIVQDDRPSPQAHLSARQCRSTSHAGRWRVRPTGRIAAESGAMYRENNSVPSDGPCGTRTMGYNGRSGRYVVPADEGPTPLQVWRQPCERLSAANRNVCYRVVFRVALSVGQSSMYILDVKSRSATNDNRKPEVSAWLEAPTRRATEAGGRKLRDARRKPVVENPQPKIRSYKQAVSTFRYHIARRLGMRSDRGL